MNLVLQAVKKLELQEKLKKCYGPSTSNRYSQDGFWHNILQKYLSF